MPAPNDTEAGAVVLDLAIVERLVNACRGLGMGQDWNNGTHAKTHGYRKQMLDALPAAAEALARLQARLTNPAEPSELPADIAEAVRKMGAVEWGAVGPKTDAEHTSDFADSLQITRDTFELGDEARELHGLYLEGTETVLCHTGTSPNSANNARALAGAWNHLLTLAMTKGGGNA